MKCECCGTEHPVNHIANPHYCIARLMEQNDKAKDEIERLKAETRAQREALKELSPVFKPTLTEPTQDRSIDPLRPCPSLLAKLGSIIVHFDEALSQDGDYADVQAAHVLMRDPDVDAWMRAMKDMALITLRR